MSVGFVGLGKLGLPVAYAIAALGEEVYGYDPVVTKPPADPSYEQELAGCIRHSGSRFTFADLPTVIRNCDVVFAGIQTPHPPEYEGITPVPDTRSDFDYSHLAKAVSDINAEAERQEKDITLAVVSTVLPGTMQREIQPLLGERIDFAYNPSFIAMGRAILDFTNPEFVLIGGDEKGRLRALYDRLNLGPVKHMAVQDAELVKVAYNAAIGQKITLANCLMEICHKTGADIDTVTGTLATATQRITSDAYMQGGMGDGGHCHPRDQIAMSWLAKSLDLSCDPFEQIMWNREAQAQWLVNLVLGTNALVVGILGLAYKPNHHRTIGSPAKLCANLMRRAGRDPFLYDPHTGEGEPPTEPGAYLIGAKHDEFTELEFPEGSVVIDPFRYIPRQRGVQVIGVGRR